MVVFLNPGVVLKDRSNVQMIYFEHILSNGKEAVVAS